MPRDRDQTGFGRMLELLMATPGPSQVPAIVVEQAEQISDFHRAEDGCESLVAAGRAAIDNRRSGEIRVDFAGPTVLRVASRTERQVVGVE